MLLGSTMFNFMAFRYLQLDEAMAILFSTPFLIAIFAGPMLGEWVGWRRWTAILVGFSGVLLVVRPGMGGIQWAALLSFGSAICYAFYNILTRMLARSDSSETTLFYANLFGCLVMAPVLPFVWITPPNPLDWGLMLALGVLGAGGHFLLILAHRRAPASVLSPFIYTQIVWASTLGYLVFGNVPSRWTAAGALVVIASGLYLLNRERKVHGAVAPIETG